MARLDALNVPWLCALLCEQLLHAAAADPLAESDPLLTRIARADKLRKLRSRIDRDNEHRSVTGSSSSSSSSSGGGGGGARARDAVDAERRSGGERVRSFAARFVGDVVPAVAFMYEFVEAAAHDGRHVHAILVGACVRVVTDCQHAQAAHASTTLVELLHVTGADGGIDATRARDVSALRATLAVQTRQLAALARFVGFVQALPYFHAYAQQTRTRASHNDTDTDDDGDDDDDDVHNDDARTHNSDGPLDEAIDVAVRAVDAQAWRIRPADNVRTAVKEVLAAVDECCAGVLTLCRHRARWRSCCRGQWR
jgi:hypothetical protein